jgi:hypothetical protein
MTPGMGRFLTPDRTNGRPSRPGSWNKYSYTRGDPINRIDALGLGPTSPAEGGVSDQCSFIESLPGALQDMNGGAVTDCEAIDPNANSGGGFAGGYDGGDDSTPPEPEPPSPTSPNSSNQCNTDPCTVTATAPPVATVSVTNDTNPSPSTDPTPPDPNPTPTPACPPGRTMMYNPLTQQNECDMPLQSTAQAVVSQVGTTTAPLANPCVWVALGGALALPATVANFAIISEVVQRTN